MIPNVRDAKSGRRWLLSAVSLNRGDIGTRKMGFWVAQALWSATLERLEGGGLCEFVRRVERA